jgi:hypothetical protein
MAHEHTHINDLTRSTIRRLAAREGATGRPEEVLDVLGIPIDMTCIERVRLILKNDIQ